MEAILLAGGLGTRLRSVVSDTPKPMALIGDKPFLWYMLNHLSAQGITRVILSVGYLHEQITAYFGTAFAGMELAYAVEDEPLGTGGAILQALKMARQADVFLFNGDTFFQVELSELLAKHHEQNADLTMALKRMVDFDRYGTVVTEGERVVKFEEKKRQDVGLINGGVYVMKRDIFAGHEMPERFSFEGEFLEPSCLQLQLVAFLFDGYFIDIGIPEDYARAQKELPLL